MTGKRKKEKTSNSQGKKKDRKDHSLETKASKSNPKVPKKRLNFTLLVIPADKILMQIKDEPGFKWPKPLSTSSRKHDLKKYCHFHKDHGHYIDECRDLKEQIEELIRGGSYKSSSREIISLDQGQKISLMMTIRMITGEPVSGGSCKSLRRAY